MKNKLGLFIAGALLILGSAVTAQAATYTVSAAVPSGTGVGIAVNSVNAATGSFTPVAGTTLTYAPLSFNTTNSVYLANNYFTFDVTVAGAGSPNTQVSYAAGSVPTGAVSTLGGNSAITFDKEVFTSSSTPPAQTQVGTPVVMSSLTTPTTVPFTDVAPGWLRIYMGLCTGNTNSANGTTDPAGCKPFTSGDAVGTYSGALTISATVN